MNARSRATAAWYGQMSSSHESGIRKAVKLPAKVKLFSYRLRDGSIAQSPLEGHSIMVTLENGHTAFAYRDPEGDLR